MTATTLELIDDLDFDHNLECDADGCTAPAEWVGKKSCGCGSIVPCDRHRRKLDMFADCYDIICQQCLKSILFKWARL